MSNQVQVLQPSPLWVIGDDVIFPNMTGWPTVGIQVIGTISAGSYTPQVSIDGQTFVSISAIQSNGNVVGTITGAGIFRVDVNGYQSFRLLADSIAGAHTVTMVAHTEPLLTQTVVGIPVQSSETLTLTGCTTTPTSAAKANKMGDHVALFIPAVTGTSNSTACTLTGLSSGLWPTTIQTINVQGIGDAGVIYSAGVITISTAGVITLLFNTTATAAPTATFTNSATTKGWTQPLTVFYTLNP